MLITAPNPTSSSSAPRVQRSTVHHHRATGRWSMRANIIPAPHSGPPPLAGEVAREARRRGLMPHAPSTMLRMVPLPRFAEEERGLRISCRCLGAELLGHVPEGIAAHFEIGE